ncbi:50S ribosomal protein L5 [Haloferula sp. A504]|uniref:50S ribosomal protein L5 n=1 Tax=Haloferula sp. A504 TaxID=3373601 RepID=UPI0031C7B9A0|nr:50S ribosomal protein L5 [Verrucomicrobiaceae bacterium E54]
MSTPVLKQHYLDKVVPALKEKLGYTNPHQVPQIEKVVLTTCLGNEPDRKVAVDDAVIEIAKITGQKPSITFSKKAVANFKLRAGEPLGARVTLRGERMWEFLYRFINVTAPNIRDFRGISPRGFDGRGNFAIGFPDQSIFPEIELDQIKRQIGFDLIVVTTATTDDEGRALLKEIGMPFRETTKSTEEGAAA